ncbi:MAG TPA: GerMN domain-containing protein [Actinomycetes bacterium]
MRRTRLAGQARTLALVCLTALAACGVPQDGTTRAVDPDDVPYRLLETAPAPSPSATVTGPVVTVPQVFFVNRDAQLVPQRQPLDATGLEPVVAALLDRLADGPSEQQRDIGLASALGPDVGLRLVDVVDAVARIEVTPSTQSPTADRLPVAVGQVVLTVTSVDGVDRVVLVQDGRAVEVPLPGGELTAEPVSAGDYSALLASTAARPEKASPGLAPVAGSAGGS